MTDVLSGGMLNPAKPVAAPLAPAPAASGPVQAAPAAPQIDPGLQANFDKNKAWLAEGDHTYNTTLTANEEQEFQKWLQQNDVPFDPAAKVTDYDMRGFWKALMRGDTRAATAINPNDKKLHYPDYWKTPYHASFSSESQWAGKNAPKWNDADQLVLPDGTIVFDEKANAKKAK